jgi:hypothetical protein
MIVPLTNVSMVRAEDDGEFVDDSGSDDSGSSDSGDSGSSGDDGSSDSGDSGDGGTTEDDGYIIGPDDSQGEVSNQDELEKTYQDTPWEKNIGPNDFEKAKQHDEPQVPIPAPVKSLPTCNDSDLRYHQRDCKTSFGLTCEKNNPNGDDACESDKPVTVRCSDGSTAEVQSMCPTKLSYCDTDAGKKATSCFDRKDIDQTTGLYPCNDGTQKADYKDCKDITGTKNSNNNDNTKTITKTITKVVPQQTHHTCLDGSSISILLDCPGASTPGAVDGLDGKCDEGFIMNIKKVCVNEIFCEQTLTASGCKFNNTPAPVSQAIPPTNDPSRTSFDLVSCKYYGAQDAVRGMDQITYVNCLSYGNAYTDAYYDGINKLNG